MSTNCRYWAVLQDQGMGARPEMVEFLTNSCCLQAFETSGPDSQSEAELTLGALVIRSAARQASAIVGPLRLPDTMTGSTEESTTRRSSTPRTRSRESTTSSSSGPIAQVPMAW